MDREECTDPISPEVAAKLQKALSNGIEEQTTSGAE